MAKVVSCRDVGMDCDFVAKGDSEQDVLQQCADHARTDHGMDEIPAEVADKVRAAIHDEAAYSLKRAIFTRPLPLLRSEFSLTLPTQYRVASIPGVQPTGSGCPYRDVLNARIRFGVSTRSGQ